MAPKRKVVGTVVRTRKKVTEESVEVSVLKEGVEITSTTSVPVDGEKVTTTEINIDTQPLTEDVFQSSLEDGGKGKGKGRALVESQESVPKGPKGEALKKEPAPPTPKKTSAGKKRVPVVSPDEETQEEDQELDEEEGEEAEEEGRPPEQKKAKQERKKPQLPAGKEAKAKAKAKEPSGAARGRKRGRRSSGVMDRKKDAVAGGRMEGGSTYKRYVWKVLKQVHPEMGVSSMAMRVLDGYMRDMFERIVDEAATLSKVSRRATLTSREIQGAVRLVLPGELARHAISEGVKAVAKFMG